MRCPRYTTARDCAECSGHGQVEHDELDDSGTSFSVCPACHGSGEMSPEREAELRDEDAAERYVDAMDSIGVDVLGGDR